MERIIFSSPSHKVLKMKFGKPFLKDSSLYSDIEKIEWLRKENGACSGNG